MSADTSERARPLTLPPASCGGDCECHLADPRVAISPQDRLDLSAATPGELVEAWKRRREDKKLRIADECLAAIRLRGLDPAELGITRTKIRGALFASGEAELDEIIERIEAAPS